MKIQFIVLMCLIVLGHDALATGFSETNSGVYVAISGSSTNESIMFNDSLAWHPYCSKASNEVEFNYPDNSYAIKIALLDVFGKQVPKTKLGEGFGVKFDQLHSYQDIVQPPKMGYSSSHIGSILAQGSHNNSDPVSGPLLPAPNELFQIEEPGSYTLEIQMQMFLIHKNTNQWSRELIRFSPVKIKVIRP